ncbi:MAG: glycogen/starch synthase [Chloroflexota bacterium]
MWMVGWLEPRTVMPTIQCFLNRSSPADGRLGACRRAASRRACTATIALMRSRWWPGEPWAKTGALLTGRRSVARCARPRGGRVPASVPGLRGRSVSSRRAHGAAGHRPRVGVGGRLRTRARGAWTGQADGYRLRLVHHELSFDRDGLYGDASGDFPDGNGARFTLLAAPRSRRCAEARPVDVLHGHDWQAGLR